MASDGDYIRFINLADRKVLPRCELERHTLVSSSRSSLSGLSMTESLMERDRVSFLFLFRKQDCKFSEFLSVSPPTDHE